jgi:hypothetical protein
MRSEEVELLQFEVKFLEVRGVEFDWLVVEDQL